MLHLAITQYMLSPASGMSPLCLSAARYGTREHQSSLDLIHSFQQSSETHIDGVTKSLRYHFS